jgi:L-asparaginase
MSTLDSPEVQTAPKPKQSTADRTRVAIVFTGGTIAMTQDNKSGVKPQLSGRQILERVPEVQQYLPELEIEVHDFSTLPGPHISPEMMVTLSEFVKAVAERCDGVVVTHGTDSMEESSYFIDCTIGDQVTAVFTGSMHPSTDAAWDGGRNLIDALSVAACKDFKGDGALVVLDNTIHAACEVTKSHTMRNDTFASHDFGPLGSVNVLNGTKPMKVRSAQYRTSIPFNDENELPYVEFLKVYSGMDDHLFVAALKNGCSGIVVEAMGQGNVPPGAVNGISRACEMNIPVVITSRCSAGPVRPYYAYEGAGLELQKLGCLFAPYLTGPKARIKLMLALAAGYDNVKLQELFPCI